MKNYHNIFFDDNEFDADLKRFQFIRNQFIKFIKYNKINHLKIINNIKVIRNLWQDKYLYMLFFKLRGYEDFLKTFLIFMNIPCDDIILKIGKINNVSSIIFVKEVEINQGLMDILRGKSDNASSDQ